MSAVAGRSVGGDAAARILGLRYWLAVAVGGTAGRVGLGLTAAMLGVVVLGPLVAPFSPTEFAGRPFEPISLEFPFGTDQLGRDVLSRVLHGGRTVILLPFLAILLAFAIGGTLGLLAGYRGGLVDHLATRGAEILMSIPPLLLVLAMIVVLGSSDVVLVLSVGIFFAPRIVRIIRGATHAVTTRDYVTAARARGESTASILRREIVPNVTGPLLAEFALRLTYAIIFIATINFLGLGVQPPSSDWGRMVSDGRVYLGLAPIITVAPAIAIAALTIGVNLLNDQLSAHLARDVQQDARL